MSFEKVITLVNLILLCSNLLIAYFGLRFNRKKDLQDNLYRFKIEAYKTIIEQCYEAQEILDINCSPFVYIYDYEDKLEWVEKHRSEVTALTSIGFGLQKLVYRNSAFLPAVFVDKLFQYSSECLTYVTKSTHGDTAIIIEQQDKLWDLLIELIKAARNDLKTDKIDETLAARIRAIN